MAEFLTEDAARKLVKEYMAKETASPSTQDILSGGAIPRLRNFVVAAGKSSDSILDGEGRFTLDKERWDREFQPYMSGLNYTAEQFIAHGEDGVAKEKMRVTFTNPHLHTKYNTPLRIMVRTERISTHDINRGEIPFKDQILAKNHYVMQRLTQDALGTSQFDVPGLEDTSVVIAAENLRTLPIEMVLRAYMAKSATTTSLYQAWLHDVTMFCGHPVNSAWIANGKLPYVLDTPSTKSDEHDKSVAPTFFINEGICTTAQYANIRNAALVAFGVVSEFVRNRGLILVDTKTEHGVNTEGEIVAQDELYTLDSSRFWLASDYARQLARLARGEIKELNPASYSKEFARGFSEGDQGYTDEQRREIAVRYIMGIQQLTGEPFRPDMRSRKERVVSGLQAIVEHLVA